ncbi:hypothetical protein AAKU55_001407 [Oxalobacteraceae bacterium GrIS 1.11]
MKRGILTISIFLKIMTNSNLKDALSSVNQQEKNDAGQLVPVGNEELSQDDLSEISGAGTDREQEVSREVVCGAFSPNEISAGN